MQSTSCGIPRCLTLAVAGATEVKNAALSQQAKSSGRAELFPPLPSPKQGSVLLKYFLCKGAGRLSRVTRFHSLQWLKERWSPGWLELTGEQGGLGLSCHRRQDKPTFPKAWHCCPQWNRCKEHLHTHLSKQIHGDVLPGEWFSGGPWAFFPPHSPEYRISSQQWGAALHMDKGKQSLQPAFPPTPNLQIRPLLLQEHLRFVHFNFCTHMSFASIIPNSLPKNIPPPYLHGNSGSQSVFPLNGPNIFISHKSKSLLKPLSNDYLKQIFSNLNPSLHNDQSHKPSNC